MAGTVPGFSLVPQFDGLGKVAPGCKLYVIVAGTTAAPQNAYQDSGLTILQPNPMLGDASGRLPQWFTADGQVKLRLTDKHGTEIFVQDNLLVIGPSAGGGGGGTVDPTTILATGDIKARYGAGILTGFVRVNGRTIGSSTSGATERANADAQALFEYLWGADANNLTVSGGRGVSANADWVANKTITLPDMRGRVPAGMDDMGSSSANLLTASYFGANGTVLGNKGGLESHTLTSAESASHTHTGTTGTESAPHNHSYSQTTLSGNNISAGGGGGGGTVQGVNAQSGATTGTESATHTHNFTTAASGSDGAHNNVQPTMVMTFYQKL